MGSVDFFLLVNLPFCVAGAVDGSVIVVDASSDVATGAAGEVAFFLFFFASLSLRQREARRPWGGGQGP